jgi:hypothetical protein
VSLKKMPSNNDKEKLLEELGLSSGESAIYLHLLSQPDGETLDKAVAGFGISEAL